MKPTWWVRLGRCPRCHQRSRSATGLCEDCVMTLAGPMESDMAPDQFRRSLNVVDDRPER